jgi:hypothetical protein
VAGRAPLCAAPTRAGRAPPLQARKKDNMSKEMKDRLRKEYVGFGGAENTVRRPRGGCAGRPS